MESKTIKPFSLFISSFLIFLVLLGLVVSGLIFLSSEHKAFAQTSQWETYLYCPESASKIIHEDGGGNVCKFINGGCDEGDRAEFQVNVPKSGYYNIQVKVKDQKGAGFNIEKGTCGKDCVIYNHCSNVGKDWKVLDTGSFYFDAGLNTLIFRAREKDDQKDGCPWPPLCTGDRGTYFDWIHIALLCQDNDGICQAGCTPENDNDCFIIFQDGFEDGLEEWVQRVDPPNTVNIVNSPVHSGSFALEMNFKDGSAGKFIMLTHDISPVSNVLLRGWFYDNMDTSIITFFEVGDNQNRFTAFGVDTSWYPNHYYFRYLTKTGDFDHFYNSNVLRSKGWHMFELITIDSGTYGKVDNEFIFDYYNPYQTEVSKIWIGHTGREDPGMTGVSYYDDILLVKPPEKLDSLYLSANNELVKDYGVTDFSSIYGELGDYTWDVWGLLNMAGGFALDYKVKGEVERLNKAKNLFKDVLNHCDWGSHAHQWASPIYLSSLMTTSRLLWNDLETQDKDKILEIISSEADYTTDLLDKYQQGQETGLPEWFEMSGHQGDSKAEENAWRAGFLASAANFLPSHLNAQRWEEAGRCFAFHTFTTSEDETMLFPEMACGLNTQTVYDDFRMDNHGRESALYSANTITELSEGALAYQLNDKEIPAEFIHNVAQIWNKIKNDYLDLNSYQFKRSDLTDWSGAHASYYPMGALQVKYFQEAIPQLRNDIDLNDLLLKNYLFYYQIASENTEPIMGSFPTPFNLSKGEAGYELLLNSYVAYRHNLGYIYSQRREFLAKVFLECQNDDGICSKGCTFRSDNDCIKGDIDYNSIVNINDVKTFLRVPKISETPAADLNFDGVVNGADFWQMIKILEK